MLKLFSAISSLIWYTLFYSSQGNGYRTLSVLIDVEHKKLVFCLSYITTGFLEEEVIFHVFIVLGLLNAELHCADTADWNLIKVSHTQNYREQGPSKPRRENPFTKG